MSVKNEVTTKRKRDTLAEHRLHERDTGSPEAQISLFTDRIQQLTNHLQKHPSDHHTRRGLLQIVGQRRRMLDYLKDRDIESYRNVVARLDLRR